MISRTRFLTLTMVINVLN